MHPGASSTPYLSIMRKYILTEISYTIYRVYMGVAEKMWSYLIFPGSGKLFFNIFLKLERSKHQTKNIFKFFHSSEATPPKYQGEQKTRRKQGRRPKGPGQHLPFFIFVFLFFVYFFVCVCVLAFKTYYLVAANKPVIGRFFLLVHARRSCDIGTCSSKYCSDHVLQTPLLLGGITVIQFRPICR